MSRFDGNKAPHLPVPMVQWDCVCTASIQKRQEESGPQLLDPFQPVNRGQIWLKQFNTVPLQGWNMISAYSNLFMVICKSNTNTSDFQVYE